MWMWTKESYRGEALGPGPVPVAGVSGGPVYRQAAPGCLHTPPQTRRFLCPIASQLQGTRPPASAALLLFLSPFPVRPPCKGPTQTACTRAHPRAHAHEGTHTDLGQQVRAPQAQGRHAGPSRPLLTWEGSWGEARVTSVFFDLKALNQRSDKWYSIAISPPHPTHATPKSRYGSACFCNSRLCGHKPKSLKQKETLNTWKMENTALGGIPLFDKGNQPFGLILNQLWNRKLQPSFWQRKCLGKSLQDVNLTTRDMSSKYGLHWNFVLFAAIAGVME